MKAQPLIVSSVVAITAQWYCQLLNAHKGHGGDNYEQILWNNEMILQIHDEGPDDHHESLIDRSVLKGNGVILWFETDDFESLLERINFYAIKPDRGPVNNPDAGQMEVWLHDPNGYRVVVAGPSDYDRKPIDR